MYRAVFFLAAFVGGIMIGLVLATDSPKIAYPPTPSRNVCLATPIGDVMQQWERFDGNGYIIVDCP